MKRIAGVEPWEGKLCLSVGGVTVAVEGDPCRDATLESVDVASGLPKWTVGALAEAMRRINATVTP